MSNMKPACAPDSGVDPRIFFRPDASDDPTGYRNWNPFDAQYICLACPIRIQCRDKAIERDEQHGVWGGEEFGAKPRIIDQPELPGMPPRELRVCEVCFSDFSPYNKQHMYCNDICKAIAHARQVNARKREQRKANRAAQVGA